MVGIDPASDDVPTRTASDQPQRATVLEVSCAPPRPGGVGKRAFDVVFAAVSVVLLAPLMLAVAVAILLADGWPVFFRQTRVGRAGLPFTMLKFRSMVNGADENLAQFRLRNERTGPLFKFEHDPRVTSLGRILRGTSLDELPQLFNVLAGTMSMVGPRPALYGERNQFPSELLAREALRPGITGLWQVEARSDPDFARYYELDLAYVYTRTMWLDIRLLCRTPFTVTRDAVRRATARRARTRKSGEVLPTGSS